MRIRHGHSIQFLVILLILLMSAQFGQAQPQRRGLPAPEQSVIPRDPVELPMHRFNRLPAIDVTINGSGPFRLIVDTGAAGLVLKNEIVNRLELSAPPDLPPGGAVVQVRSPGGPVSASLRYVKSLEIGNARFRGIWTIGVELPFGDELDGVVGMNVFSECLLTYDYPGNRIQLTRGALPNANGRDVLSFSTPNSPGSHPIIELNIDGKAMPFMIDTGMRGWFAMPLERAKLLKIVEGPVAGLKSLAVGGSSRRSIARVGTSFELGHYTIEKPLVSVAGAGGGPVLGTGMVLGTLLLEHFVVTFDVRNNRVRFARESNAPITPPSVRLLGLGLRRKGQDMEVWAVCPGSHAASLGITEGSLVHELNGKPARDLYHTNEWSELLQTAETVKLLYSPSGSDKKQMVDVQIVELLP